MESVWNKRYVWQERSFRIPQTEKPVWKPHLSRRSFFTKLKEDKFFPRKASQEKALLSEKLVWFALSINLPSQLSPSWLSSSGPVNNWTILPVWGPGEEGGASATWGAGQSIPAFDMALKAGRYFSLKGGQMHTDLFHQYPHAGSYDGLGLFTSTVVSVPRTTIPLELSEVDTHLSTAKLHWRSTHEAREGQFCFLKADSHDLLQL